ncbi:MAG: pantetheine-phosphate adenylyltransferase [Lachnospiraceae bacterium]
MKVAVYPGSFDPVTYGHLDVIVRAGNMFDQVIVGVLDNSVKTPLFSAQERVNILQRAVENIGNVTVQSFNGLSVNFARDCGSNVIVRGLRAITDFDYELQMAQTNRILAPDVDTIFLSTNIEYSYLSSTTFKEVAAFGGDTSQFAPQVVVDIVKEKMESIKRISKEKTS